MTTDENRRLEGSMFETARKRLREEQKMWSGSAPESGRQEIKKKERKDRDGKTRIKDVIVPKHRSAYSPKPGESVGPAKPNRNVGKRK